MRMKLLRGIAANTKEISAKLFSREISAEIARQRGAKRACFHPVFIINNGLTSRSRKSVLGELQKIFDEWSRYPYFCNLFMALKAHWGQSLEQSRFVYKDGSLNQCLQVQTQGKIILFYILRRIVVKLYIFDLAIFRSFYCKFYSI